MYKQIRSLRPFGSSIVSRTLVAMLLLSSLSSPPPSLAKNAKESSDPDQQAPAAKGLKKTPKYQPDYKTDKPEPASVYAPTPEGEAEDAPKPDTVEFARAQMNQKDFKGALSTYKTIFLARPYDADVLLGMAYCCEQLGNLDEAIKNARDATMADPKSAETHIALGYYLEKNRDLKAAWLQYSRAIDLKPDYELMERVWTPTVRILINMNNVEVAIPLAHKWVHDYPKEATVQYNNGWVLSQAGDEKKLPEAVQSYEAACRLDPGLVGAHYNLALLHLKMANKDAAITELDQFIKLAPNDPDVKQAKTLFAKLKAQGATPIVILPTVKSNAKNSAKKTFKVVEPAQQTEALAPAVPAAATPPVPISVSKDRPIEDEKVIKEGAKSHSFGLFSPRRKVNKDSEKALVPANETVQQEAVTEQNKSVTTTTAAAEQKQAKEHKKAEASAAKASEKDAATERKLSAATPAEATTQTEVKHRRKPAEATAEASEQKIATQRKKTVAADAEALETKKVSEPTAAKVERRSKKRDAIPVKVYAPLEAASENPQSSEQPSAAEASGDKSAASSHRSKWDELHSK